MNSCDLLSIVRAWSLPQVHDGSGEGFWMSGMP